MELSAIKHLVNNNEQFNNENSTIPSIADQLKEYSGSKIRSEVIDSRIQVDYGYVKNDFFRQMVEFENRTHEPLEFVEPPVYGYWLTYELLNKDQLNYYLYWRSECRKGNYLESDSAYIYINIYELLSGIGYKDPIDGYNQMLGLWKNYRKVSLGFDKHMFKWTFDFAAMHRLPYSVPDFFDGNIGSTQDIVSLVIWEYSKLTPLKLPISIINSLCEHNIFNSNFYKNGNQELMKDALPRVIALLDANLRRNSNTTLLDTYGPKHFNTSTYYLFSGAVCSCALKRARIQVRPYLSWPGLSNYITNIMKFAENELRDIMGYRGKLRNIEIDESEAALIHAFLRKEYSNTTIKIGYRQPEKVVINFDSLDELRKESDDVRDALYVEDSDQLIDEYEREKFESFSNMDTYEQLSIEDMAKPQSDTHSINFESDDTDIQNFLESLTTIELGLIQIIISGADIENKVQSLMANNNTFLDLVTDEINSKSMDELGDILLEYNGDNYSIVEEYEANIKRAIYNGGSAE